MVIGPAGQLAESTELKRCSMIEMRWNKYEVYYYYYYYYYYHYDLLRQLAAQTKTYMHGIRAEFKEMNIQLI